MRFQLLGLALILVTACSAPSRPFPANTGAIVEVDLFNRATCGPLNPFKEEGAWTPSADDIRGLETALIQRLVPELERDALVYGVRTAANNYYRRYAGVTVNGVRLIAICGEQRYIYERSGVDWPEGYVPLSDGGSGTFGALYNPATRQITYFEFGYVG